MKEITVLSGQTLIDIAMQELGDATRLFELATLNGLLPSDDINAGETINVPEPETNLKHVVNTLQVNKPASEVSEELKKEGIGYWAIGFDFKVS